MYLKLLRSAVAAAPGFTKSDRLVVVFDTDTPNANSELSPAYKANRRSFTDEEESPYKHIPRVQKALDTIGVKYLEVPNYEADDVVASLARLFSTEAKGECYIVSWDTDFFQLVREGVSILKLKTQGEVDIIDESYVVQKVGVLPSEYVFYKSLMGDTADNIQGVPGIGPVRARKVVNKLLPFDANKYQAVLALNSKLITLNEHVPLQSMLSEFTINPQSFDLTNQEVFTKCDF